MNWTVGIRSGQGKHETESETDGARSKRRDFQPASSSSRVAGVFFNGKDDFERFSAEMQQIIYRSNRFILRSMNM
jgi:hypothetical protein